MRSLSSRWQLPSSWTATGSAGRVLALGGVAHKPWRNLAAEQLLVGKPANGPSFTAAADLILREATGHAHNAFKIDLARRAIVRALAQATAGTPQVQSDKRIQ